MIKSDDNNSISLEDLPLISETLPLIIKKYNFPETLSGLIHHSNKEHFDLNGPHVK